MRFELASFLARPGVVGPLLAASLFLGAAPPPEPAFRFEDATLETGLQFTYRASGAEALQLPAIMGGGAAFLDFDRDGDLDLFLAQGGQLSKQGPSGGPEGARLYRNDLGRGPDGRPQTHFVDVTAATGAGVKLYGLGVATGDYDGDGFVDLFVAGFGGSRLLRNVAGKRFEDATVRAGVGGSGFAVAATFFDFDRDGDLDLFVARYVHYPLDPPVACFAPSSRPDYCGPQSFAGEADLFYVNRGDGTFEEASARLTPEKPPLPGLGVVAADFDRDGWPDLLVANDGQPNQLWHNLRGRRFEEVGLEAGVALNGLGLPEANMGIAVGDADGDLAEDVLITHLTGETNTFFHQTGPGQFEDRSTLSGLGPPSRPWTGFGAAWLDPDRDGDLDLATVAGAVRLAEVSGRPPDPLGLGQKAQLFRNLGGGQFAEVSATAGPAFGQLAASRGLAVGDVDNDGDLDLVVVDLEGPARLLLDRTGPETPESWLGLRLTDASGKRDQLGATAVLRRRGAPPLLRRVHTDGSYASASDPRLLFGLAAGTNLEAVEVTWPDGQRERFNPPPPGRYTPLAQGKGQPLGAGGVAGSEP